MIPRRVLLAMFWLTLTAVTVLSLLPDTTPLPSTGWDKANHALGFAVLAGLADRCWPGRTWRVAFALLAYGIGIEVAQSLTPTRRAEGLDVVADAAGIAMAQAIAWGARRIRS